MKQTICENYFKITSILTYNLSKNILLTNWINKEYFQISSPFRKWLISSICFLEHYGRNKYIERIILLDQNLIALNVVKYCELQRKYNEIQWISENSIVSNENTFEVARVSRIFRLWNKRWLNGFHSFPVNVFKEIHSLYCVGGWTALWVHG